MLCLIMEKLSVLWEKLTLSEAEGNMYKSESFEQGSGQAVAAKFFTHRALNMEAITRTFKPLWRTRSEFEVKDVGNHTVLFVFSDKTDAERVLIGEPWSYDKHLVSLRRLEQSIAVKDLDFNRTLFWVQIHDLPIGDMSPRSACEVGEIIGEVQSGVKEWGTQDGSSFMRIRVLVDTSKPLCRGRKICIEDGTVGWVRFKYERLPNLCYWCGLLTHSDKDCDLWVQSRGSLTESDQQYGGWLRAPSVNSKKCSVVRVEGSAGSKATEVYPSSLARGEEMDTSETIVADRCMENDNQEGLREELPGPEVNEVGPDPMPE